jgi:uncharacterized protein (TIGR03437 family)
VSPNQINAQIPLETALGDAVALVRSGKNTSAMMKLAIKEAAPGIFMPLLNQDGSVNAPDRAASPGSTLHVFVTGLDVNLPSDSTSQAKAAITATIGTQPASLLSTARAPGLVGVYQVNLRVPHQPPGAYPLTIWAGGTASNSVVVHVSK